MKRDIDLVRKILLAIEQEPSSSATRTIEIDGYDAEQIGYHAMIMEEAGLVVGGAIQDRGRIVSPNIQRLTWAGHEFLDASRDEGGWRKALEIMKKKGGGITFDVLKELLLQLMRANVFGGS